MGHKQAAIRYSVASQTFAPTCLVTDVTALVIQGSSSAKFVGIGGTNSKSHGVSSGDLGDQEHQLTSSLVACPLRHCGCGLLWCSRNVRRKGGGILTEYDLSRICVKLRRKPVNKPAQRSFPIRWFSGGKKWKKEKRKKRPQVRCDVKWHKIHHFLGVPFMPDDFVWIVRSLDIILAVDFTPNWSVASSLETSRAVRKFLLKLWICNSRLVHELIAVCKLSKERLPDNTPDQIQFMIKPISWFLWATLKGFPCSLHRVVGYAWMTWISSLADATPPPFFFKPPTRNWFTF